jgi:hypothetical protein
VKRLHVLSAGALLLAGVACSSSKSGPSTAGSGAPGASAAAKKAEGALGASALSTPEDNYLAAASKIACLGLEVDTADAFTKERDKVLKAHAYTEDSWVAASKQLGKSKSEAVVGAMKCAL